MSARIDCDVAVIGAGPAGIAAAVRAAVGGARVCILDQRARPGGNIWRGDVRSLPAHARGWLRRLEHSGAQSLFGATVFDIASHGAGFEVGAEQGSAQLQVRARTLVLATGARELFLPFPGWTLPNVFGVGGAQALLKSGMNVRGKRVVIAGSGPLLLPVAASFAKAGAHVLTVAEQAALRSVATFALGLIGQPATLLQAARYRVGFAGTPYHTASWPLRASGEGRVERVELSQGGRSVSHDCDILCAAFGLIANTELPRLLGCEHGEDGTFVNAHQETSVAGVYCAGETTGIGGAELALVEGELAGLSAVGGRGGSGLLQRADSLRTTAATLRRAFALRPELSQLAEPDTIVCRCEDVAYRDINPEWNARTARLYIRAGMGACQGRVCGAALAHLRGWDPPVVRMPVEPVQLSSLLAEPEH